MLPVVNIAAYKFVWLKDLPGLRAKLREFCNAQDLRGSILLSPEGINLFAAGSRNGIDALLAKLKEIPGLGDLPVKESQSREQPFNRMLVKIKGEIIPFGIPEIEPASYTSRRLKPAELKAWLDEGRPVTLLDARNDFEVGVGTFAQAVPVSIDDFRNFPEAAGRLPDELKAKPIVTFCTGGIRCEKAAPYLERLGFQEVYQLDGGILKYFEEVGGEHFRGLCFVFDKRVAVDSALRETGARQCHACWAVLSEEDVSSPLYAEGDSCPHCARPPFGVM